MTKGRNCSLDYLLSKNWIENIYNTDKKVIYIIGGLYGNHIAMQEIIKLASDEKTEPLLVFNGDVHWFDVEFEDFSNIEHLTSQGIKLLGNVEYELTKTEDTLGCGCNYPDDVSDGVVERSNDIHKTMKENVQYSSLLKDIKKRERAMCVVALGQKIAITHGDEKNMAGWQCSSENLKILERQQELNLWLEHNRINIMATTHTCLPAVLEFENKVVINNGSSGMANTKEETYGLLTRIALDSHPKAIVSKKVDNVYVELVKIDFNLLQFLEWFDKKWPEDSPASISYRNRITNGTSLEVNDIVIKNKMENKTL